MTARPYRFGAPPAREPVLHELPPLRFPDRLIPVNLSLRCDDDGMWRARLLFLEADGEMRETVEIFCAPSEPELWEAVRTLPGHHLRALYQSLA
jgi:hypothetical protein